MSNNEFYLTKSKELRRSLFKKFCLTNGGHPGSVFSILDTMVALYYGDFLNMDRDNNKILDKVIMSKGHAASVLYPILVDKGVISKDQYDNWGVNNNKDSDLRIFSNVSIPGIDATSGSLGHGLGIGAGYALSFKKRNINRNVYVIISEGELYEGSIWESLLFINHYRLTNLKILLDRNNLMILGNTEDCIKLNPIEDKLKSFGCNVSTIDGHNYNELLTSFENISSDEKNINCLILNTVKGKGVSEFENKAYWHYWQNISDEKKKEIENELS